MECGVFNQKVNITPIPAMTRRIVESSLNLQTDEILDVNDGQAQATDKLQHLCAIEHAEGGAAECMEQINAAKGRVSSQVLRNVFRMEGSMIAQRQKAIMGIAQVLKEENKIDIQSRPLHAAHGHGKSADQSVANASGRKFSGNFWNGGFEIHVVRGQGSAGDRGRRSEVRGRRTEGGGR